VLNADPEIAKEIYRNINLRKTEETQRKRFEEIEKRRFEIDEEMKVEG
jgi:hypothetical protein